MDTQLEDLVRFLAEELVEAPEEVKVQRKETRRTTILKLRTAPDDTGRVIGRNGRSKRHAFAAACGRPRLRSPGHPGN